MAAEYVSENDAMRARRQIHDAKELRCRSILEHEREHALATLPSRAPPGNEFFS
jgi:hypothetical protein